MREAVYIVFEDADFIWSIANVKHFDHLWISGMTDLDELSKALHRPVKDIELLIQDRMHKKYIRPNGKAGPKYQRNPMDLEKLENPKNLPAGKRKIYNVELLHRIYHEDMSVPDMIEAMGMDNERALYQTILRCKKKEPSRWKERSFKKTWDIDQLKKLYDAGVTEPEIKKQMGFDSLRQLRQLIYRQREKNPDQWKPREIDAKNERQMSAFLHDLNWTPPRNTDVADKG